MTLELPCAIIIFVGIEETYPLEKTGQNHKGSWKTPILKGSQNEYLRRQFIAGGH